MQLAIFIHRFHEDRFYSGASYFRVYTHRHWARLLAFGMSHFFPLFMKPPKTFYPRLPEVFWFMTLSRLLITFDDHSTCDFHAISRLWCFALAYSEPLRNILERSGERELGQICCSSSDKLWSQWFYSTTNNLGGFYPTTNSLSLTISAITVSTNFANMDMTEANSWKFCISLLLIHQAVV